MRQRTVAEFVITQQADNTVTAKHNSVYPNISIWPLKPQTHEQFEHKKRVYVV